MHIPETLPRFGLFAALIFAASHQARAVPSDGAVTDQDATKERLVRARAALEGLNGATGQYAAPPDLDHEKFAWYNWSNFSNYRPFSNWNNWNNFSKAAPFDNWNNFSKAAPFNNWNNFSKAAPFNNWNNFAKAVPFNKVSNFDNWKNAAPAPRQVFGNAVVQRPAPTPKYIVPAAPARPVTPPAAQHPTVATPAPAHLTPPVATPAPAHPAPPVAMAPGGSPKPIRITGPQHATPVAGSPVQPAAGHPGTAVTPTTPVVTAPGRPGPDKTLTATGGTPATNGAAGGAHPAPGRPKSGPTTPIATAPNQPTTGSPPPIPARPGGTSPLASAPPSRGDGGGGSNCFGGTAVTERCLAGAGATAGGARTAAGAAAAISTGFAAGSAFGEAYTQRVMAALQIFEDALADAMASQTQPYFDMPPPDDPDMLAMMPPGAPDMAPDPTLLAVDPPVAPDPGTTVLSAPAPSDLPQRAPSGAPVVSGPLPPAASTDPSPVEKLEQAVEAKIADYEGKLSPYMEDVKKLVVDPLVDAAKENTLRGEPFLQTFKQNVTGAIFQGATDKTIDTFAPQTGEPLGDTMNDFLHLTKDHLGSLADNTMEGFKGVWENVKDVFDVKERAKKNMEWLKDKIAEFR